MDAKTPISRPGFSDLLFGAMLSALISHMLAGRRSIDVTIRVDPPPAGGNGGVTYVPPAT